MSILRRMWQSGLWRLGFRHVLPDLPSTLMVEPTNLCNLHCPACPTGAGTLKRPPRTMTFPEFRGILDQALKPSGYLRRVTLFNYGEPFLCKDLLPMVAYASSNGLQTFVSTNGHFFGTHEAARAVVQSGLTELVVCLDGADQETISRYRRNARFDDILTGIRRVVSAKTIAKSRVPVIELQFIVMKHNEHQRAQMRKIAQELGVNRFIEKTVGIPGLHPQFQRLADELLPTDLSASRYERLSDGSYRLRGAPPCACEYIYSTMVINSNGDVVPCCYDIHSDHVMGNVFQQPLKEIWRGAKFRDFRRRVASRRDEVVICRHCPEGRGRIRSMESIGTKSGNE